MENATVGCPHLVHDLRVSHSPRVMLVWGSVVL
jgi:hypothetical protein